MIADVLRYLLSRGCGSYNFGQANVEILTFNKTVKVVSEECVLVSTIQGRALFRDRNIDFQRNDEQSTSVDLDRAVRITYNVNYTNLKSWIMYIYVTKLDCSVSFALSTTFQNFY